MLKPFSVLIYQQTVPCENSFSSLTFIFSTLSACTMSYTHVTVESEHLDGTDNDVPPFYNLMI